MSEASIIKGTTPTISYKFNSVNVNDIIQAYLTIKENGILKVKRDLTTAVLEDKYIIWTLTQSETLSIASKKAKIMLNWVTQSGTRGGSKEKIVSFEDNHINEVI